MSGTDSFRVVARAHFSPRAVYGTAVPVHARDPTRFQHQGIGTLLMEEAERIAREEHGSRKLAVISGIGVRSYCESFPHQDRARR